MTPTIRSRSTKSTFFAAMSTTLFVLAVSIGCAGPPADEAPPSAEPSAEQIVTSNGLAGTAWQLVKIMSMDDTVEVPDDPLKYTLTFGADGTAMIVADCNRGQGPWTSESGGQLEFGPIAATQAMCLPSSLSDTFLAQFQWVRSYVVDDGRLYLATMADGSIIEFEPLELPVVATVYGEEIRTTDATEMQGAIVSAVLDRYAAEHGIEVSDSEVEAFIDDMERGMAEDPNLTAEDDLTPEEAAEAAALRREMARSMIRQWKVNRALYDRYGGRIIYQQLGPEPLDAYRQLFEERQEAGAFEIRDPELASEFWRYFTDDSMHSFMEPGSEDAAQAFTAPPWERAQD